MARRPMAQHLSGFPRALAVALMAAPVAFAQNSLKESALKTEPPKNFVIHETPEPGVALRFEDGQAQPHSLVDFRGRIVLLNVWATWCAPCIKEIPALDRLAAALDGADVAVVAVSIDRKGIDAVRKAFAVFGTQKLVPYVDPSGQALRTVRAVGLPTSLLLDREGREFGRVVGAAAWDDAETIAFFRRVGSVLGRPERQSSRTGFDPNR